MDEGLRHQLQRHRQQKFDVEDEEHATMVDVAVMLELLESYSLVGPNFTSNNMIYVTF